ncbi:MAG: hypothetical protein ACREPW_01510 [Candidatus Binataceae bacterium]
MRLTTHAERSRIASGRQRRRWSKVPKRARSEHMRRINYARWEKVPAGRRSRLMSEMQRMAWAKIPKGVRSAMMYERFWTWFSALDDETRGKVLAAIQHRTGTRRRSRK